MYPGTVFLQEFRVVYDLLINCGEALMKKLILITVFVLLGTLANTAMAAKPRPEPTPETITLTAGLVDIITSCDVANHTDQAIEVFMNVCEAPLDNSAPIECWDIGPSLNGGPAPVADSIDPGHYRKGELLFKTDPPASLSCEITYTGFPGDITGTMCGFTNTYYSCLPLQPR
jgi:hypothetical protein